MTCRPPTLRIEENGHSAAGVALDTEDTESGAPGFTGLLVGMGVFVIVGIPMVFFIWRFVNEILAGYFVPVDAAMGFVFLIVFVLFLRFLGRRVVRWDADLSA